MGEVLVVGAGGAGLAAARSLTDAGHRVQVVDKGRGVGGRLATRRIGDARLDHGAQFFTVRSAELSRLTGAWLETGVAREWCRGFRGPPDGHPRYVGSTGMTALAKDLAGGLDVMVGARLRSVSRAADGRWSATADDGSHLAGPDGSTRTFDAVVVTSPVPQTLEMLDGDDLDPGAAGALATIRYEPTLAALAVLAGPPAIPAPGGVQVGADDVAWIGDNHAKGVSPVPAVTVHASGAWSQEHFDEAPERLVDDLLERARPYLGAVEVLERQLARWRYATPVCLHEERFLVAGGGARPLVCAGDAFGEAKVEGAIRSGWAAAEVVIERLAG